MGELKITLKKSPISSIPKHRKTLEALGLRKVNHSVIKKDNPATWGMINQLNYMLEVEKL